MKKKLGVLALVILVSVGGMIFSKSFTKEEQLKLSTKGLDNTTISEVEESKDNSILDDEKKITVEEEKGKDKIEENKEVVKQQESVENKRSQSETKISEPSKESKGESQNGEIKNNEVKTETENSTNVKPKEAEKKQEPNVRIVNDITGEEIASGYVNIDGKSAYDVTVDFLNKNGISKKIKSGYFSSIAGLEERKPEKTSGWCYYVNGVKPGIGSSAYNLKNGDKLVWKFLLDGINN
ncbi:DUF4430 domain-containing protein [Clostridium algidicarnis]|uniref:DUF4430 domain-containing protein n=1 Tax=Clostridium algidicarnis TaxID=37659 RepID=UPI001C0D5812|nr:DUF4430 domain-containing protein [Clostridium algidicarnis]MBU3195153.1 DUF4430 domain-containing protein [Clostridium algidicarnis]